MLDLKLLRDRPEEVRQALNKRGAVADLDRILELDGKRRQLETRRVALQAESNSLGKKVGELIRQGADPQGAEVTALRQQGADLKAEIAQLEQRERELEEEMQTLLLTLPNLPLPSVPVGQDETENVEVRRWGDALKPTHPVLPHDEVAEKLGLLEVGRAVKVAQSRFVAMVGAGAALERALIAMMLERHIAAGYTEVIPPFLVNSAALEGTGQLPKFAAESFRCADDDLWLIPTAEVPLTNLYREEVIPAERLPLYFCAYTPCFRREAGSYGRDTKGLIRLHQFQKVELVKVTHPTQSEAEHEKLVQDAEAILQMLELPYRVVELCTGDLGFSAARCFDLEVWFPSQNRYREISSCSNCWDFQARRANLRYKEAGQKGTHFVHTLNGSGLAVGRALAALLENHQQPDGSIRIPQALRPFLSSRFLSEDGALRTAP
ncbi:serine--tRNA ligase [Synechococcus sp. JA-3-3Ab]|uniref:Serine--tRNA ligase n=1 Tax=Synechococcus sp. (strain JA-3-3Ab) TaxID=321327 RepID=SYS_SYNJA|nr:serine--tRNA ligase [Synechococcus sp. JA-3-3Ab]Q2JXL1.1 RecName: Full=Serine--tRNA ligase; AltName: Full=Seryl-tRNA synthetase; Short=SerRS; AltName: Full=Seryl-tRNA(Ser/Sec) synthetase [Synechococcus sp. JA-3-3Ab]ABC98471.1 seryl-tRNA synthetase [Synechococcus sp. JA-3-3Ab]